MEIAMKFLSILLLMNFLYAGSPAFTKLAGMEMAPLDIVFLRHSMALLCFLPFFLKSPVRRIEWRDFWRIPMGAFIAFTAASILQIEGMRLTRATDGAFIMALEPIAVIALAVLFLHEKIGKKMILGLLLAMAGFLTLSGNRHSSGTLFGSEQILGNLLFLCAVFCEASFPIFLKPLLKKYPPLTVAFYSLLFASLTLLPFRYEAYAALPGLTPLGLASVLYLGLGVSFTACFLWLFCLKQTSVSMVALSWFVQPFFGCLIAFSMLGESPSNSIAIGGTLILSSLFLLMPQEQKPQLATATHTAKERRPTVRNPRIVDLRFTDLWTSHRLLSANAKGRIFLQSLILSPHPTNLRPVGLPPISMIRRHAIGSHGWAGH